MNEEQFARLLDSHGANSDHWPEAQRAAALALCAVSPPANEDWMAARRLEAALAAGRAPVPDATRQARVIAGAMAQLRAQGEPLLDWRWLFTRTVGAAFAASVAAGWLVGMELAERVSFSLALSDLRLEDLFL